MSAMLCFLLVSKLSSYPTCIIRMILSQNLGNKLAVGHSNIQGGLTSIVKCLDVQNLIFREKLDILCLNETNLKSDIETDTLALPSNFTLLRKDRNNDSGRGGCGILIGDNIKFKTVDLNLTVSTEKIESLWIHLIDCNIYLCSFYRSEQFCPLDTFLGYMSECMIKLGNKKVVMLGDINVDQNNINTINYRKLDQTMRMFGLVQTVQGITRIAKLGDRITHTTIDIVMTNTYSHFLTCDVLEDRIGDHQAIKFTIDFNVDKPSKFKKILIRDHCKSNISALKNFLKENCDYSSILESNNVNEAVEGLNAHVQYYYDIFCPIKQIKCHSDYIHKPSEELLKNIKLRRKLYRKYKKHQKEHEKKKKNCLPQIPCMRCNVLWDNFKMQKNYTTKLSRRDRRTNIITELKAKSALNDLKGVWKTIKKASNLPTKASNTNNNLDAEESNKYFAQIGPSIQEEISKDNGPNDDNINYHSFLNNGRPEDDTTYLDAFNEVTETEVLDFIKSLPGDKSTNDPIPLKIFKQILPTFISPFTHIVNLSLKYGIMPDSCKIAMVTPIHKSGKLDDPGNYRPISILPVLSKTIEHLVNSQLTQYLDDKGVISKCQYGFRKDHSTTYLMLDLFDRIYSSKSKNNRPGIIFLDIKKAFDTVNHNILLSKLKHYGIKNIALRWFESFLTGRKQQTRVGSRISDSTELSSGVPQGSILGPILFTLFINDLPNACIQATPYLFADDGALYFDNIDRENYLNIKVEIKSIYKWLQANKLALNADKTNLIIFDSNAKVDNIPIKIRQDLSIVVRESKSQKYLGLIVDNKLNFYQHIEYIKKKVSKRIGAMYRSKNLLPLKFRKMFANALMLPHFDYLDIIWCKTYKSKLKDLDISYKKIAKIALDVNIRESSISVYKQMGWLPLHLRRQLHLSSYMYRIVNEICPRHFIGKFSYISGGSRGGENCNLYTQKSKSHKEFFYLGAKAWNVVPQTLRASESVKHFSNTFKTLLLSKMLSDGSYLTDNSFNKFYHVD